MFHELAIFIAHVEELSAAMQREIKAGPPVHMDGGLLIFKDDGSLLVTWRGEEQFKKTHIENSFSRKPLMMFLFN